LLQLSSDLLRIQSLRVALAYRIVNKCTIKNHADEYNFNQRKLLGYFRKASDNGDWNLTPPN
jgi:hypothetical protein